jgi:hypothetical protein
MPKKIIYINASLMKESSCLRRLQHISLDGYTNAAKDHKIEYGSAFHVFAADRLKGISTELALKSALTYYTTCGCIVPDNDYRTDIHLAQTCLEYDNIYQFDSFKVLRNKDGSPLVEQVFGWPIYQNESVEVILCGTIDAIGMVGNEVVIMDHKTTGAYNIGEYLEGYNLSVQFMTYQYIVETLARTYPDTFGRMHGVGTMINGVFIKKAGATFQRSQIIRYEDHKMKAYESFLMNTVKNLVDVHLNAGSLAQQNFTCCENIYGKCKFFSACAAPSEESRVMILDNLYVKKDYNPMTLKG